MTEKNAEQIAAEAAEAAAQKATKDAEKAAAKAIKDQIKAEAKATKDAEKAAAKAAKEAAKLAAKEAASTKIIQNGVTRPKADSMTGKVWEISDSQSAELGAPAPRKGVLEACVAAGLNSATAATQYGLWRKFNGLEGSGNVAPAAPTAPAAE